MKRFPFRNFHLPVVLAAVLSLGSAPSALAEHEWGIDKSTTSWGLTNDLWRIDGSFSSGTLGITGLTPTAANKDPAILDVSGLYGFVYNGTPLTKFQCWSGSFPTIETLVISDATYGSFVCRGAQMPNLEEVRTPNADDPHRFSVNTLMQGALNCPNLAGNYEFVDVSSIVKESFSGVKASGFKLSGNFTKLEMKTFYTSYKIKSIDLVTSGTITSLPEYLVGHWGNQTQSLIPEPVQLTSFTLNGTPILRSPSITSIGNQSMSHCALYSDIVDLPNCASIGEYALRGSRSVPFVNLMGITSLSKEALREFASAERIVFGNKAELTMGDNQFYGSFVDSSVPSVIWNSTTVPNGGIVESTFGGIGDNHLTNYIRKEARAGWDAALAAQPKIKQNFVSMDTVFTVKLRLADEVVMTTLMPGVAGEDSVWTISADWFLPPGATFGTGSVKDVDGTVIPGASATPMDSGKKLSITLPQSLVLTDASTTLESEVFVDLAVIQNEDSHVTVTILDGQERAVVTNEFDVPYGGSAVKDYAAEIFGDSEYTYNQVLSLVVDPEGALGASMDFSGKLTVSNAMESAAVTVKINRTKIPKQMDHWEVSADGYSMTDGIWTFRCDFNGTNAVVANAESFLGSDLASVVVDFSLPIFQNGISVEATRFDWGAEINGSAIDLTKNNCGKSLVINGSAATPNTLIAGLVLPSNPIELFAGWGGCTKLALDVEDLIMVTTNIGAYALCETRASGDLTFPDGKVVTIGPHAFDKCLGITSVTIRGFGSTIGGYAFRENSKLTSADIGGVVSLGQYAFSKDKLTTLVICPLLQSFPAHVFDYPSDNLTMSVAEVTTEMLSMKAIDGSFGTEAFRDYRGKGALIFPFRGTITSTGTGSFKWLGPCTNIVFWGKAPAEEAFSTSAVTEQNASQSYTRRITVSKAMDEAGWTAWATPCTDEEKARADYPGDSVCFGTHSFGAAKLWMCWGRSPWEISPGLLIMFR